MSVGLSRRDFLKLGAAVAGGGVIAWLFGEGNFFEAPARTIQGGESLLDDVAASVSVNGQPVGPGEGIRHVDPNILKNPDFLQAEFATGSKAHIYIGGVLVVEGPALDSGGHSLSVYWPDGASYKVEDTVYETWWSPTTYGTTFSPGDHAVHEMEIQRGTHGIYNHVERAVPPGKLEGYLSAYADGARETVSRLNSVASGLCSVYKLSRGEASTTEKTPLIPLVGSLYSIRFKALLEKFAPEEKIKDEITKEEYDARLLVIETISKEIHTIPQRDAGVSWSAELENSESALSSFFNQHDKINKDAFAEVCTYFSESKWTKDTLAGAIQSLNTLVSLPLFEEIGEEGLMQLLELLCYRKYITNEPVDAENILNAMAKNMLLPTKEYGQEGLFFTPEFAGKVVIPDEDTLLSHLRNEEKRALTKEFFKLLDKRESAMQLIPEMPTVLAVLQGYSDKRGKVTYARVIYERNSSGKIKIISQEEINPSVEDLKFWDMYAVTSHTLPSEKLAMYLKQFGLEAEQGAEVGDLPAFNHNEVDETTTFYYSAAILDPRALLSFDAARTKDKPELRAALPLKHGEGPYRFGLGPGENPDIIFLGESATTQFIRAQTGTDKVYFDTIWQQDWTELCNRAASQNLNRVSPIFSTPEELLQALGKERITVVRSAGSELQVKEVEIRNSTADKIIDAILPNVITFAVVSEPVEVLRMRGSGIAESFFLGGTVLRETLESTNTFLPKGAVLGVATIAFDQQGSPYAIVEAKNPLNILQITYYAVPLEKLIPKEIPTLIDEFRMMALCTSIATAFAFIPIPPVGGIASGFYMYHIIGRMPLYIFAPLGGLPLVPGINTPPERRVASSSSPRNKKKPNPSTRAAIHQTTKKGPRGRGILPLAT